MEEKPAADAARYRTWCRRLQASDRTAFEALFRATYPNLFRYARRLTGQAAQAEDVVQEAFLRIWTRRASLDAEKSLRSLLYVTVRHLAFGQERKAHRRKELREAMVSPRTPLRPDETTGARELGAYVDRWVDELPERRREAFRLSRYDGLTYAEIAEVMGLSIKTVENHIWLALRHVRQRLKDFDPDLLAS